jgi:hypothetical protein
MGHIKRRKCVLEHLSIRAQWRLLCFGALPVDRLELLECQGHATTVSLGNVLEHLSRGEP